MQGMLGFCNLLLSVSVLLTNEYKYVSLCLIFDLSVKPEFAVPPSNFEESAVWSHLASLFISRLAIDVQNKDLGSFGFSCWYLRNECLINISNILFFLHFFLNKGNAVKFFRGHGIWSECDKKYINLIVRMLNGEVLPQSDTREMVRTARDKLQIYWNATSFRSNVLSL